MILNHYRQILTPQTTIGSLYVDGEFLCFLLEDAVRPGPKIPGQTAIPYGTYKVVLSMSQRFGKVMPELKDVPDFTGIRYHWGNKAIDTEGCPLTGTSITTPYEVAGSMIAYSKLMGKLQPAWDTKNSIFVRILKGQDLALGFNR